MANVLKMAKSQSILSLHALGWKQTRIAAELGVDRETVRKYLRQQSCGPKPANAPTGSENSKPAGFSGLPAPQPKPAENAPTGSSPGINPPEPAPPTPASDAARGPVSQCEPYHDTILGKLDAGLSLKRIHQDLAAEGIAVHYDALRRYVRRLGRVRPLPFRRLECQAGEEAQADFGRGAPVLTADGKRRKTHVFRIVLSQSRKGHSEATFTQTTDDFLRVLENAFRHFGGVPRTLVIDNLKAAVAHPDWFDPELTPKVQSFCQHYGTVILPTRPYTPRHKGKVESGVKYVKNNGLKGHTFSSLQAQQEHLHHWEATVADTRIHGTTKRQVAVMFAEEQPALGPLPLEPFRYYRYGERTVHLDGCVEVEAAYYG
ncbi:MAG: IS21 family transposase, partial [Gemmataceae bacterium]